MRYIFIYIYIEREREREREREKEKEVSNYFPSTIKLFPVFVITFE